MATTRSAASRRPRSKAEGEHAVLSCRPRIAHASGLERSAPGGRQVGASRGTPCEGGGQDRDEKAGRDSEPTTADLRTVTEATGTRDRAPAGHRAFTEWLLKGGHSLLAYAGSTRGYQTVSDAVAYYTCRAWLEQGWADASRRPTLPTAVRGVLGVLDPQVGADDEVVAAVLAAAEERDHP